MSITQKDLTAAIEGFAPPSMQEPWDNSGWQINLRPGEVSRILVSLEIIAAVADEAKQRGADVILTHHPLFFMPMKNIDADTFEGGYAADLIRAGISVYSAHTSFDAAPGGMNDALAEMCGLTDVKPFLPDAGLEVPEGIVADGTEIGSGGAGAPIARSGKLEENLPFWQYTDIVARQIGMEGRLKMAGDPEKRIRSVVVCGGGGGDYIPSVIEQGFDLYITSDIKHHQAQWAKERGLCLIDGGHYGTEKHFVQVAAANLRAAFGSALDVVETAVSADPFL
ncbi:MAG: Nif3-like dinuclear metal center hexameric protein [Clostridiales Family XIII bacterium]|jgi:dinuclear metal center YbgI/SA1388 family protein|nr:Nif3-like dinuclear metal center hexameric protein [Clostridiales Family XIII bacterium]